MSYKKLLIFVLFFLLSTFLFTSKADAAVPVTGWAWSSNIGWILFDTGKLNPVEISTTTLTPTMGKFSGYAWSSNVGWISFNSSDVSGCSPSPASGCQGSINLTTGAVSGWARVVSGIGRTDGWDGWIELSGTNHASPTLNGTGGVTISTSTGVFNGYAWGGNVVGWVQFLASCPGCKGAGTGTTTATSTIDAHIRADGSEMDITISSGNSAIISWDSLNADNCTVSNGTPSWKTGKSNTGVTSGLLSATTSFVLNCTNAPAGLDSVTKSVTVNVSSAPCTVDCGNGTTTTGGDIGKMWVDGVSANSSESKIETKVRAGGRAKLNWRNPTGAVSCVGINFLGTLPGWASMSTTSERLNGSPFLTSVLPDIGEYKVKVKCGATSTNAVRIIVTDPTIIEI